MPRYKLTIEYDGTHYCGWQKQLDERTVQGDLIAAVKQFCSQDIDVVGAGRTDTGVHATAQIAHIDLAKEYDPFQVTQGINYYLFNRTDRIENRIAVLDSQLTDNEFHARFSATQRHYLYRIVNRRPRLALEANRAWHVIEELDIDAMREGANHLLGTHDFTSFRDTQCQAKSPIKTLEQLDIVAHGNEIHIIAAARSFLHHQVRIMVGTLSLIGKGRWKPEDILVALNAKERSKGGPTAPPEGLYLTQVDY